MTAVSINDSALISKLRDGDEKAFEAVYNLHYKKVYRFAQSIVKDSSLSEEILQETFLNLWLKRDKLDADLPVEPLLFTMCRRLVVNNFRRLASMEKLKAGLMINTPSEDNCTEERIIFSDLIHVAENAIAQLPTRQQAIFRMTKIEGLTYQEIATELKISKNTVRNHFVLASKTLKLQLYREGVLLLWFFLTIVR